MTSPAAQRVNKMTCTKANTDSGSRALLVRGPKLWNDLPPSVKEAHTLTAFKLGLQKSLLDKIQ